jgi:cell division protein FtsB
MRREMREDFRELKTRLTLLEQHFATHTVMQATQSGRIDRLEERLERVERRLELHDENP